MPALTLALYGQEEGEKRVQPTKKPRLATISTFKRSHRQPSHAGIGRTVSWIDQGGNWGQKGRLPASLSPRAAYKELADENGSFSGRLASVCLRLQTRVESRGWRAESLWINRETASIRERKGGAGRLSEQRLLALSWRIGSLLRPVSQLS